MIKSKRNPVDVTVGLSLRRHRMAAGLSLEQLGGHIGVTYQQIQKYETGANRIALSTAVALAKALACRVSDLLEGVEQDADRTAPQPPSIRAIRLAGRIDELSAENRERFAGLIEAVAGSERNNRPPRAPIAADEPAALAH